jgi:hypothetical protein
MKPRGPEVGLREVLESRLSAHSSLVTAYRAIASRSDRMQVPQRAGQCRSGGPQPFLYQSRLA